MQMMHYLGKYILKYNNRYHHGTSNVFTDFHTFFVLHVLYMLCLNMQMRHYLMVTFGEFRRNLLMHTDKVIQ